MAANAKFFLTAQDLTGPAFGSVNKRLGSAGKRVAQFAGSIAAAAGIGGMGLLIKNAVDAGDAIHKLNLRLGASAVALSEYQHVAELSGVKFEALTKAWQKQQDGIADAVSGTGEARVALDKLGLSAQALSKLAPEEQFEAIAAALGGVEQAGDRVNIAQDIWGAKGAQLLQVTAGGADAIKHMRDEAHALGLTLTQTGAQNMA
ncbi:MAG: hypothetical protein OEW37_08790, partial [Rhodospirillaceae bacterium]|nr:hypothetical protein [Rhodospirillaceae bacterium]